MLDADGFLTITDRKKDVIVRGGENVSALVRVASSGSAPDLEAMRTHLDSAGLARQKWPEELRIVDELPRTPRQGQKIRVARLHCDRKPTRSVETSGRAFRARPLRATFLPNRHLHATRPMCATCRGTRVTAFIDEGLTTARGRRRQHDALHIPRFSHPRQGATMLHKRSGASRRGVANLFPRASRHSVGASFRSMSARVSIGKGRRI